MVIEHNMKGNGMKWKVSMRDEFGGSGTAYIEADTIVQAMREAAKVTEDWVRSGSWHWGQCKIMAHYQVDPIECSDSTLIAVNRS